MRSEYNALRILLENGWVWDAYNEENEERYKFRANILGKTYSSEITAVVYDIPSHLVNCGDYGVTWLEAKYEYDRPYEYRELEDMQQAIITAEENLLTIGMPFVRDYNFHGKNAANKKRRNDKLRRIYNIEEEVKEDQQREQI